MNDQPPGLRAAIGQARLTGVNWGGLRTLYVKEVRRFFKVQTQTIWAPAVTTLLFLIIFSVALGGAKREVLGVPFATFIAPGLIVMAMIQNAFANSSFSLLVGKIQGTIIDYLMPPLSPGQPRQSLLLRDLGLPPWLPVGSGFGHPAWRNSAAGAEPGSVRRLLRVAEKRVEDQELSIVMHLVVPAGEREITAVFSLPL